MSISTTWRMALVGVGYAYEKFMLEVDGRFLAVLCNFLHIAGEQVYSRFYRILFSISLMYLFKSRACNAGHCLGTCR